MTDQNVQTLTAWQAYRMRLKRRRLLWRSFRSRHQLSVVNDRTSAIGSDDILMFAVVRNERERLDEFLDHYRSLGVGRALIIDNGSDDGSLEYLAAQKDVSLWETQSSYRASRFGLDWVSWLLMRFGHGHWCLTVDADEYLMYSGSETHDLQELTAHLDQLGKSAFGALMLDLYPKGPIGQEKANWFDQGPYRASRQLPVQNLWVQGGARERIYFNDAPERSPTLNKLPLVKWNRRYCYVNSTHALLPPRLNYEYDGPGRDGCAGVLLHRKFDPSIVSKSETERARGEHFGNPTEFADYYDKIAERSEMWSPASIMLESSQQLVDLDLMPGIEW